MSEPVPLNFRVVFSRFSGSVEGYRAFTAWHKSPTYRRAVLPPEEVHRRELSATVFYTGWDDRLLANGFAEVLLICNDTIESEVVWMVDMIRSAAYLGCTVGSLEKAIITHRDMTRVPLKFHKYLAERGYTAHREIVAKPLLRNTIVSFPKGPKEKEEEEEEESAGPSRPLPDEPSRPSDPLEHHPDTLVASEPPKKRTRLPKSTAEMFSQAIEKRISIEGSLMREKTLVWYPWGSGSGSEREEEESERKRERQGISTVLIFG